MHSFSETASETATLVEILLTTDMAAILFGVKGGDRLGNPARFGRFMTTNLQPHALHSSPDARSYLFLMTLARI